MLLLLHVFFFPKVYLFKLIIFVNFYYIFVELVSWRSVCVPVAKTPLKLFFLKKKNG